MSWDWQQSPFARWVMGYDGAGLLAYVPLQDGSFATDVPVQVLGGESVWSPGAGVVGPAADGPTTGDAGGIILGNAVGSVRDTVGAQVPAFAGAFTLGIWMRLPTAASVTSTIWPLNRPHANLVTDGAAIFASGGTRSIGAGVGRGGAQVDARGPTDSIDNYVGRWVWVVGTWQEEAAGGDSRMRVYLDGALAYISAVASPADGWGTSTDRFFIGPGSGGEVEYAHATIWGRALSGNEIAEGYARSSAARVVVTEARASAPVHGRLVEETIILRGEGGRFLQVGRDAARGITHEGLSMTANRAGPDSCTFTLRRDPAVSWPDLSPYNKCIIEVGGAVVWSGRMREAPGQSGQALTITFTGSGGAHHLDDDLLAYGWVHAQLGDWRDWMSYTNMRGVSFAVNGLIAENDGGELRIGWPNGATIKSNTAAGMMLDLGEHHPGIVRVAARVSMQATNPWTNIYVRGSESDNALHSGVADYVAGYGSGAIGSSPIWISGTIGEGKRYVMVFIYRPALGDIAATAEHVLRIHEVLCFADAADESGNASDLRASTVIGEVIASGHAPLLSDDTSRIEATSFAIPHYWPREHLSPRELIEPVNAFHDYDLGVDVDRRVYFRAPAERASLEVGSWSGAEFTDASAGSGEDVYSKVVVDAIDGAGQPVQVIRTAGTAAPELARYLPVDGGFTNPSFEVDLSGWTISTGGAPTPAARSIAAAHHGSASLELPGEPGYAYTASADLNNLVVGRTYRVSVWAMATSANSPSWSLLARLRDARDRLIATAYQLDPFPADDTWREIEFAFVAPENGPAWLHLRFDMSSGSGATHPLYVDDARVELLEVNAVDRHGFVRAQRLPVGAPLSVAAAEVMGDVWLRNHLRTPLKGSITVTGQGGVREAIGGAPVHPAHLLLRTGEVVRHTAMADPDTGAWGRNGRIASVSYSGGRAVVELDNERHRFEALVARYAALRGVAGP